MIASSRGTVFEGVFASRFTPLVLSFFSKRHFSLIACARRSRVQ
jgi:hypothetical protein